MTDFDYIPIETTEGHRPPGPAADRLLIGLAAAALCGGLLIAAGNFLGADETVSLSSESPAASAGPSRTPRPSPSPRPRLELAVQPAAPPSTSPGPSVFSGWIRASTDLVIRIGPRVDADEVGVLAEGAVAQVDEWTDEPAGEMGWLHVNTPQPQGWVATLDGGTSLAQRYATPSYPWSAGIWSVAAGDEGFLAVGTSVGRPDAASVPIGVVSANGTSWRRTSTPPGGLSGWGASIAWGPVGWLSAVMVDDLTGPELWISRSAAGREWSSLGVLRDLPPDTWLNQLVASERGYLLVTGGSTSSFWYSVDGVSWRETDATGLNRGAYLRVAATSIGFYVWEDDGWGGPISEATEAAFSVDGRTWSLVPGGPGGSGRQVVLVGDRLLGIDVDPVTTAPRLWIGIPARGSVAWLRDTNGEAVFTDAAPSTMVSDGKRAIAFGWDRSTEDPLVWTSGPTGWTRSILPEEFGGIPRLAAAGPAGVVVVGSRPTLRGTNPIFWHETAAGSWAPELSPVLPIVPDPSPAECGPPPLSALEFVVLDRPMAIACLGDEPITFRAWSAQCEGCYGGGGGGSNEPEWLFGLTEEQLYLSPVEDDTGGWWTQSVIHPSLEYDRSWRRQWLEVTGHFDDPAASECLWTPSPGALWYYEGRRATVDQCRQQFVVTEVTAVSGP